MDIVIFKRQFPKIHLGGNIDVFFAESVLATIEVKSKLTKSGLFKAMNAALKVKALHRNEASAWIIGPGYKAPGILCFLISYDGPKNMVTVGNWVKEFEEKLGLNYPPLGSTISERMKVVSPSLDGIFVIGKGLAVHDSLPIWLITDDQRAVRPDLRWYSADIKSGVLLFFCVLTTAGCGVTFHGLNAIEYLKNLQVDVKNLQIYQ